MKITTIILFAALMQVSAATMAQRLTLPKQDITLKQLFNEISKQTDYTIVWSASQVNTDQSINIEFKDTPLLEVLDKTLQNTKLSYTIEEKTIVIKEKQPTIIERIKTALGVPITITAKVYDELGQPLPGVTIRQKETNNTTTTDTKGNFSITLPDDNTTIQFTYIGYEPQELRAKDIPNGSAIKLKVATNNLKEVVINKGYYNERRELSTGDVGIVTAKEIQEQPVSDPIQALIGRVPGLNITQSSGIPGAYDKINIRGQNSIANGNDPLYIIDGVPFSSVSLTNQFGGGSVGSTAGPLSNYSGRNSGGGGLSPFNALNPYDIENITVLKDADATAIYGSRGANGVILITTRKGKLGATKVDFNISQGVGQVTRQMDLLNTQQYLQMEQEALKNDGIVPGTEIYNDYYPYLYDSNNSWDTTRYTNWQKVLIGNVAHYNNIQGTISGGNANIQFLVGAGYNRQTTVYPGDYSDSKGSIHVNITHSSSNQKFQLQFNAGYLNDNSNIPTTDLTTFISLAPDAPMPYNSDHSLNWKVLNGSNSWDNPFAYTLRHATAITNNLTSSLNLAYQLLPGLKLSSNFGYTHDEMNQNLLSPAASYPPPLNTSASIRQNQFGNSVFENWIIEPQLTYIKQLGKGHLDALIGATFQQNSTNAFSATTSGYASDALIDNPKAASNFQLSNYSTTLYHYSAFYGRIGYNWEEKYLLNFTARRDGSSRFGPGRQFGNFGAVGTGWIFSKEKIIENGLPFLSFGKIKISYGTTGNDQITDYQFLSTYSPGSTTYQGSAILAPSNLQNSSFAWEVVKKFETGMDLGFLKDRINLEVNYYVNRTGNQLVGYPLPNISGFSSVQYNLPAIVQNSGLELTLNTINIKSGNFGWTTTATLSIPQNKLVAYPGLAGSNYRNSLIIGQSILGTRQFQYTDVNPQTGIYSFSTQNADGIPSFPQDYIKFVSTAPKYNGGFDNNLSYKGLQLDIFIQYVKQTGINYTNYFPAAGYVFSNQPTAALLNRWRNPGDNATNQQLTAFNNSTVLAAYTNLTTSNAAYTDASFIRLKTVSLSYNLPKKWLRQLNFQNARVFLQGQNLLTITNYLGLDPETQGLTLPPLRMITLGISASL